jgi:hypothetical protein
MIFSSYVGVQRVWSYLAMFGNVVIVDQWTHLFDENGNDQVSSSILPGLRIFNTT